MNLTRLSIVFVLIAIPFLLFGYMDTLALQKKVEIEQQYTRIIYNAVDDGASVIRRSAEDGGLDVLDLDVDPEEVVDAFLASWHYGFKAQSATDRVSLNQHLVILLVTAYDGFYIYGIKEVDDGMGGRVMTHVLSEKEPYVYEDASHLIHVTLGSQLRILNKGTFEEVSGDVTQVSPIPSSIPLADYDLWRSQIVTESILKAMTRTATVHNRYGRAMGLTYEFHMPVGDHNALAQAVQGPGLMAFIQGQPIGGGDYLEVMTFGQGNVVEEAEVIGYMDGSGNYYYCDDMCIHPVTDTEIKRFRGSREAASEGYYPCHMFGK